MSDNELEERPRYGILMRGGKQYILYAALENSGGFTLRHADTDEMVDFQPGDVIRVDHLIEGQNILYMRNGKMSSAHTRERTRPVNDDNDDKGFPWHALLGLAIVAGIFLGVLAGIKAIFWGF